MKERTSNYDLTPDEQEQIVFIIQHIFYREVELEYFFKKLDVYDIELFVECMDVLIRKFAYGSIGRVHESYFDSILVNRDRSTVKLNDVRERAKELINK